MQRVVTRFWFPSSIVFGCLITVGSAGAQIVPDATLPVPSVVTPQGNINVIEGGSRAGGNLFHSFQEFSVPTGGEAFFNNALDVQNIFSRVTGGSISQIDGLIKANGTANLFLLNPNGIIFRPNAQLKIGGSFLGSTASSIRFADGVEFSATNPQTSPLLSINVPIGLQYGSNPGSIQVQKSDLRVNPGNTLALVGGNISIDGGQIFASGGRVELGGLAETGTVELSFNSTGNILILSFPDRVARSDVSLTNMALVNVAAGSGGSIAVNTRNLDISEKGKLSAGIGENSGSIGAVAGDINVDATGTVTLQVSSLIQNIVDKGATGNAGSVNLVAGSLNLLSGSQLFTSTFGQGNAGIVNVNVRDIVSLDSAGNNSSTSGIISSVGETGIGKSGDINITTGSLSVTNGAQLNAITFGRGDAGNVTINARDTVSFDGANAGASGILASVSIDDNGKQAIGNGGNINITTGSLAVTNGAQLNAITRGVGNAGNVTINARDMVSIDGQNQKNGAASAIFTAVNFDNKGNQAIGNGGNINITTWSLFITNGAELSAITFGKGNAGNVIINAHDMVTLDGEKKSNQTPSQILTSVASNEYSGYPNLGPAIGNGGDISITTGSLSITRGAGVNALTKGRGNAGNVTINARDTVILDGENSKGGSSGIFSSVDDNLYTDQLPAIGNGGDIRITTGSLSITRGGGLFANTRGQGNGGRVIINARDTVTLDGEKESNGASTGIFTSVGDEVDLPPAVGKGGDIHITTRSLLVTRGGGIFANTVATGNAGNVRIDAREVSLDGQNSNGGASGVYTSVAQNGVGKGGDIDIATELLSVTKGGGVFATTAGRGDAGNVNINASDRISLDGLSSNQGSSGVFSNVKLEAEGNGGNIRIRAGEFSVTDGARLSSSSESIGWGAGNIQVSADSIRLNGGTLSSDTSGGQGNIELRSPSIILGQGSSITTNASAGESGGNIDVGASSLILRQGSSITTNGEGSANVSEIKGGNIVLNTDVLAALENSDITANSNNSFGGQVIINAQGVFGTQSRNEQTLQSDITAKGRNPSFSGTVQINTPEVDPNAGLVNLPENVVDTSRLLAQSCIARRRETGTFYITGTGGLPTRPGDAYVSPYSTGTVRSLPNTSTTNNNSSESPASEWEPNNQIVEAQEVYKLENGQMVLGRPCP